MKALLHRRLEWLKTVARDKEVSPNAARLAAVVCLVYLNAKSGTAWPSLETLADDVGLSRRYVRRLARELERLGYLTITNSTGRGRANVYRICTPERGVYVPPLDEQKGGLSEHERGAHRPPQHIDRTICKGEALSAPLQGGRLEAAPGKKKNACGDFEALRAIWLKRNHLNDWDAAKAAYHIVVAGGADPGAILAGAQAWFAAKGARFLPALDKFIANETYLQSPGDPRAGRGGAGAGKSKPMSAAEAMLLHGGYEIPDEQ